MMDLENLVIQKNESILDALGKLNKIRYVSDVSRLILFVVDEKGSVVGSLTDGDIRRSLIQHADLAIPLEEICNRDFVFSYESTEFMQLEKYRQKDLKVLPILDQENKLVRVVDLEKTQALLPLECMIMAGGRGKRLSPLTDTIPKPMLPLGGKPIIEHNIDRLISFGIQKIYISVKYLGEQIEEYFGDGSEKGICIEYIWEDEPLGTAGALSLVKFESENVLLMNSDLFTNVDFEDLYLDLIKNKAGISVASVEYKIDVPYAVFETNGNEVRDFKEKPSYIYYSNAGIYVLKKDLIGRIPKNEFYDITELMEQFVKEGGKMVHSPIRGYWIDIGKPADYQQAQQFIKHS